MVGRKKRKEFELPLAPLIDVFTILVIYLVVGTYFAPADMVLPPGLKLPFSDSKEDIELATQVHVSATQVSIPSLQYTMPVEIFKTKNPSGPQIASFQAQVTKMVNALSPAMRQNGVTLNFVADKDLPYVVIFNVLQAVRVRNVDNVLFIATGS